MNYFSVPSDFKKETIDAFEKLHKKYPASRVLETYGNLTIGNELQSGRPSSILPQVDIEEMGRYIYYCRERGIDFNYTLNAPYMGNREFEPGGMQVIYDFLRRLYDAGVRSLTVTLPSLMEFIRESGLDFKVKGSTVSQVTTVNKALELKALGLERIVPDESLNRDFRILKRIRDGFGPGVEIIANSICHVDCSYRAFHYNQIAGESLKDGVGETNNYYPHKCLLRRYGDVSAVFKLSWVRPEDLHYYRDIGIAYFKLQGRPRVLKGDPVRAVECYFKESYDGDLMDLLNLFAPVTAFKASLDNRKLNGYIKPFAAKPGFCRHDCEVCGYCLSFAEKVVDAAETVEVLRLAEDYYRESDPFKKMVKEAGKSGFVPPSGEPLRADEPLPDDEDFDL